MKDKLKALGLNQKQIDDVIALHTTELESHVPKSKLDEAQKQVTELEAKTKDYAKQLADVKKSAGDNEALTKQIADMEKANAESTKAMKADFDKRAKIAEIRGATSGQLHDNAFDSFIGQIDLDKVTLTDKGLHGLTELLPDIQKSHSYLFKPQDTPPNGDNNGFQVKGAKPMGSNVTDPNANSNTTLDAQVKAAMGFTQGDK